MLPVGLGQGGSYLKASRCLEKRPTKGCRVGNHRAQRAEFEGRRVGAHWSRQWRSKVQVLGSWGHWGQGSWSQGSESGVIRTR